MHALQDIKRLGFYLINLARQSEGRHSYDYPEMETWRSEMLENRPAIDPDLLLP
jgi:hypothetical protein